MNHPQGQDDQGDLTPEELKEIEAIADRMRSKGRTPQHVALRRVLQPGESLDDLQFQSEAYKIRPPVTPKMDDPDGGTPT